MVSLGEFFNVRPGADKLIFMAVFAAIVLMVYFPIGIPVPIQAMTQDMYDIIDALQPGDKVLVPCSVMGGQFFDTKPGAEAMIWHLASKDVKIVFVSWGADLAAPQNLQSYIVASQSSLDSFGYVYGTDWVWFGFVAGGETAVGTFAQDIHTTVTTDVHGTAVGDIPMMADIHTAADFDLMASLTGTEMNILQIVIPYGITYVSCIVPITFPLANTYYTSGLLQGFVNGQRGGAEYELLVGRPGFGLQITDGLNSTHILAVAFIILGNIVYWTRRSRGVDEGGRLG